jgi:hypothetical protein
MEDGVSRMSWSSVRPCYITESRCWAQKEVKLQRIFFVTGTSRRLSPTPPPHTPPAFQPNFYSSGILSATRLMWPHLHPTKQVNISSGGYIMPYTYYASQPTEMRIVKKFPHTAWNQVWKNLHASPVSDEIKIHMVQGAARPHPYQRQISRHQPHRLIRLLVVWPPRLPAA